MSASILGPWPSFTQNEIDKVNQVITSGRVNYWTGNEGKSFEKEFAEYIGCNHAIALANGTLALELALKALDVGPGDEVIVTPRTFIASISCVVTVGATPVFADVDLKSGNISAETIIPVLSEKTKAVICVHLGGIPCEMEGIMHLSEQHDFYVIEDCAQAHGAEYQGKKVGNIGHINAFSYCQDKIMTTLGEGGMLTTNDESLWKKAWAYKDHGKSWDAVHVKKHPPGYRWLHESFGSNFRMTEVQSAVGREQLKLLDSWVARRTKVATAIIELSDKYDFLAPDTYPKNSKSAFYRVYLHVNKEQLPSGVDRDSLQQQINDKGLPCFVGSCSEVYKEKAFDGQGFKPCEKLVSAYQLGESSLCFLTHPTITDEQLTKTLEILDSVFSAVTMEN